MVESNAPADCEAFDECDFIFLPDNPHNPMGNDPECVALYCYNPDACDNDEGEGCGCFEEGRVYKDTILQLYQRLVDEYKEIAKTDSYKDCSFEAVFFDYLWPELGWHDSFGVYRGTDDFDAVVRAHKYADYPFNTRKGELEFLVDWASGKEE